MKRAIYFRLMMCLPLLNVAFANERWETHSTMESTTFGKMDLGIQEDCRETNWQETNPMILSGSNDECENFSSEQKAGKWIFSYHCQASSGKGEFTSKADGLIEGFIKTNTPQGDFLLRFTSHRKGVCQIEDSE